MALLAAFFSVVVLSINKIRFFKDPTIFLIFFGMMAGMVVGTHVLANFDTRILKRILGIVVLLFAVHIFIRERDEGTPERSRGNGHFVGVAIPIVVGVFAGLAGGLFGTCGPPVVIYVDHFAKDKTAFRAQILVLFVLHDIFRMFVYSRYALLNMEIFQFTLWLLPAVCLGLFVGSKLHFRVNVRTFSRAVAAMLFMSGLLLLKP